jgi:general secretion pathway protein E
MTLQALPPHITRDYLLHHRVCPIGGAADHALVVAVAPDGRAEDAQELADSLGREVEVRGVTDDELERMIERLTTQSDRAFELTLGAEGSAATDVDVRDLVHQPPVVRYVNLLVRDAFDARASDIHLEAIRGDLNVRLRIDGNLIDTAPPPRQMHAAVVSRLKLLAELDISERRRPQDGRIRVRLESRELDIRVATIPTSFGESVVLRLLDHGGRPTGLEALGLTAAQELQVRAMARRPNGLVLVTGPTGSGKTSTLYSMLHCRDGTREKLITLEDPVEYELSGVTQVPVHRQSGVTFASALRAVLRQDPDVVMIGEMRDAETAETAVQAALTGHQVLSTLHTIDALSAIPRLLDLGVPAFLLAAVLEGVMAQRLVRRICEDCRVPYEPDGDQLVAIGGNIRRDLRFERGAGCVSCHGTGYRGRIAIFELLTVTPELKQAIARGEGGRQLSDAAMRGGWQPLRADGLAKVMAGLTTTEEVFRALHA